MAKKTVKDLKNLTDDELVKKVRETEASLFQAKMKHATGQLEDTASLWRMRKTLARAKTYMSQKAAR